MMNDCVAKNTALEQYPQLAQQQTPQQREAILNSLSKLPNAKDIFGECF